MLKFEHQRVMVDDIECSGQVKQTERRHIPIVGSEQEVILDLQDGCLSAVEPTVR